MDSVKKFYEIKEDKKEQVFMNLFRNVLKDKMFYEVLRSSINIAKENPTLDKTDILEMALRDWDLI